MLRRCRASLTAESLIHRCPICFERFENPRALPCIHTFCGECLNNYLESNDVKPGEHFNCPICKGKYIFRINHFYLDYPVRNKFLCVYSHTDLLNWFVYFLHAPGNQKQMMSYSTQNRAHI